MPIPAKAPMEHPIKGFSSPRDARTKTAALVHGGTSLKLSDDGDQKSPPLLEAHPGSPVDINRPRPSFASSLAVQRTYHGSPRSLGRTEDIIRGDGVAAKETSSFEGAENHDPDGRSRRKMYGLHPFYIPTKVPEQEEVHYVPSHGIASINSADMEFEFVEDNGIWISASPVFHGSKTSLATTTTATSTLIDDKASQGTLTVDTSVASCGASMVSSDTSIYSAVTTNSSDVYGWEEELDRKTSAEGHHIWEQEINRRLPSGSRTMGPRSIPFDSKRKSLLHRVLKISRRGSPDEIIMSGGVRESACPTTSA